MEKQNSTHYTEHQETETQDNGKGVSKLDIHSIAEILNKFGFALVLGGLFIWNALENGSKLDALQVEYRAAQRVDREDYIKLNKDMIETLATMNDSLNGMATQIKETNERLEKLEIRMSKRDD